MTDYRTALALTGLALGALSAPAMAQDGGDLMSLDGSALRDAIDMRYQAAITTSNDSAIVNADDPRYLWAIDAKAQCGIALGYLKSGTKDPVSIGKCDDAYQRMMMVPRQRIIEKPEPTPQPECERPVIGAIFFDFDSAVPPASARDTLSFVRGNYQQCGWNAFVVTGHTDRSGSDAYNDGLSQRRAQAIADEMGAMGVPASMIETRARGESEPRVPTPDGVRNPQNRRVEIEVR
ncbi:OmpA family protein [Erythrobacter sp. HKB08]|uniref:OmpA family protein n=1 Tax=Erythrobacter sp. HKB08 TaxID=2502843 RepID=UPI001F3714AD|nr:OmpA family protein [Erythrobacter sp. HKB08]